MNGSRITAAPAACLLVIGLVQPADAHRKKPHTSIDLLAHVCILTNNGRKICNSNYRPRRRRGIDSNGNRIRRLSRAGKIIGSRPAGCPHAYCGCGLRKYLGLSDKRLNLAWNWARLFPHEHHPRPGLAAVRYHHVMYIESAAGKGLWRVRDYNSGGGLSRLHVRDVRGYVFVNPHAQVASR